MPDELTYLTKTDRKVWETYDYFATVIKDPTFPPMAQKQFFEELYSGTDEERQSFVNHLLDPTIQMAIKLA